MNLLLLWLHAAGAGYLAALLDDEVLEDAVFLDDIVLENSDLCV